MLRLQKEKPLLKTRFVQQVLRRSTERAKNVPSSSGSKRNAAVSRTQGSTSRPVAGNLKTEVTTLICHEG